MASFDVVPLAGIVAMLRHGLARAAGVPEGVRGVVVRPRPEHGGTGLITVYELGALTLVWPDPVLVPRCRDALEGCRAELVIERIESLGTRQGQAELRVVGRTGLVAAAAPTRLVDLDTGDPAQRHLLAELAAGLDPGEADEAELDLDDLDPVMVGLLDGDCLVGQAGWRPFDLDGRFADIGVTVRPDWRNRGGGAALVARAAERAVAAGLMPLYRHDVDNQASAAVARSRGFRSAARVRAVLVG